MPYLIDFTKSLRYRVSRTLGSLLRKCGCTDKVVNLITFLHQKTPPHYGICGLTQTVSNTGLRDFKAAQGIDIQTRHAVQTSSMCTISEPNAADDTEMVLVDRYIYLFSFTTPRWTASLTGFTPITRPLKIKLEFGS